MAEPVSQVPTPWLGVPQAAVYLGVCTKLIRSWARRGRLRAGRVGRAYRFRVGWLDAFVELRGPRKGSRRA